MVSEGFRTPLDARSAEAARVGATRDNPIMNRDDWDDRYRGTDLVWSAEPNQFVAAECAGMVPSGALDLAAGEGRNAIWLAEQGWSVTAIDYSNVGLAKARSLAESRGVRIETIVADVTTYTAEPIHDLVLMAYLQLPEPDRWAALRHAVGALVAGGTLLVVAHDRSNLDGGYGGPQDPAVLATPEEVAAALADLMVVKAERVERAVITNDGVRIAIDHVVRAVKPL